MGVVKSNILNRIEEHAQNGEFNILGRRRKRTVLSKDFRELLLLLRSIEGSPAQRLRRRTSKVFVCIEEWNPSFPMSGKLSTELMKVLIDLRSTRLERSGKRVRIHIHRRKNIYAKANDIANKSMLSLIRLLFWPIRRSK